jgi:two-component system response regulator HydG
MHRLKAHDWPGNIRELENAVQRALILCDGQIEVADLPAYLHAADRTLRTAQPQVLLSLREMEQQHIRRVLDAVDGNKTAAAKILGINQKTLQIKLKE